MKVGFDLSIARISQAGTAIYATNLIRALAALDSAPSLSIFQVDQSRDMGKKKTTTSRLETLYRDVVWTHWSLPRAARRATVDLLHMPANIVPIKPMGPTVVTILDTIALENPEHFTPWFRNYARFFIPRAARYADRILTISENSKNDLIRLLGVPQNKVSVTYLATSSEFRLVAEHEKDRIRKKYDLRRYILTVGTLEPRKNIVRLLRAFSKLTKTDQQLHLVHVGPPGWMFDVIMKEVAELSISDRVKFLGHVPLGDLPALYGAAEVFAYPSLYEGFGLPVLEAMSCGCPVVASNNSSIPEVAGDAAELVDPLSEAEIMDAMRSAIEDKQRAESMRELGLQRAASFSWERCARQTMQAYQEVLQK